MIRLRIAIALVGCGWVGISFAQAPTDTNKQQVETFAQVYERWRQVQDVEEKIALTKQALAMEPGLTTWPLQNSRERTKGNLLFSLGNAYANRIHGDRADNWENAISSYNAALNIFTRERFSKDWARANTYMGIAYYSRVREDRADNLEKAIALYEAALTVQTRKTAPQDWGATQYWLGSAYWLRIRGNRADNLEKAIASYESAISVVTREEFPQKWAYAQNSLGNAYWDRIRGDRADNLEKTIAYYREALTVYTREALPLDWATTQNNLGLAYWKRQRGDRADNLEMAIGYFDAALTVRTREALPQDWATTQFNVANAYGDRVVGDRADNVERAIAALEAAAQVRTRESYPEQWAQIQNVLGLAYGDRIRGDRAENKVRAIAYLEAALSFYTRGAFPRDHLRVARSLGSILLEAREWHKAGAAYAGAREAFQLLFGQGLEESETRDLVSQAGPMFSEAAFAAIERGERELALTLASEGKARLLAVALRLVQLEVPVDKRARWGELRTAIRAEEHAVEAMQGIGRADALEKLVVLRNELLDIINSASPREAQLSTLERARTLLPKSGALVLPLVTKVGGKILVVTKGDPRITVLDLPELNSENLDVLIRGGKTGGWLGAYNINYIFDGPEKDARWPEWTSAILDLGPELWRLGAERLQAALRERGVEPGARLIWMPTGALGILPVGLAQDPVSKRRIGEAYEVVYAPSLEVLTAAQALIANNVPATLAAIVNPIGDLPGTDKEGAIVASHFAGSARTTLKTQAATVEAVLTALKGRTYWHFATHGEFSWEDARTSALIMNGGVPLTVGRLLDTDGLRRPRLVVLSACETGLYDINRNPDEFVGLPGAFAALGAAGVLATLWPVEDNATALLMAKFYELHRDRGLTPPTALFRAQAWLRKADNKELTEYFTAALQQGRAEGRHLTEIQRALSVQGLKGSRNRMLVQWMAQNDAPEKRRNQETNADNIATTRARPYAHPYYWAGFIYTGY
jgi:CHAT domain-containing protein